MERAIQIAKSQLHRLAAFWPEANRTMQEQHLLRSDISDCSYTVRSTVAGNEHFASISVKVRGTILHFKVCVELSDTGVPLYRIPSNKPIASRDLIDLIERHYKSNPLEGNGAHGGEVLAVRGCYLSKPVPKPQQSEMVKQKTLHSYIEVQPQPPVRRCSCGIPLNLTKLPDGWSVHRSSEPGTQGLLYFQNSEGKPSWLPHPQIDKKCSSWSYLEHGDLNTKVYQQHPEIMYDQNSELAKRLQSPTTLVSP